MNVSPKMNVVCLHRYQRKADEIRKAMLVELMRSTPMKRTNGILHITRDVNRETPTFAAAMKELAGVLFEDVSRELNINAALHDTSSIDTYLSLFKEKVYQIFDELRIFGFQKQDGGFIESLLLDQLKGSWKGWIEEGLIAKINTYRSRGTIYHHSFGFCYILHDNTLYLENLIKGQVNPHGKRKADIEKLKGIIKHNRLVAFIKVLKEADILDDDGYCTLHKKEANKVLGVAAALMEQPGMLIQTREFTRNVIYTTLAAFLSINAKKPKANTKGCIETKDEVMRLIKSQP